MRLTRIRSLLAVGATCFAFASQGCSSSGSPSPTTSTFDPASIVADYGAVGEIPNTPGFITRLVFLDTSNYVLKKTTGSMSGEALETETGTYAVDASNGTLTLTDSTGQSRAIPFRTPGASSVASAVHPLGVGLGGSSGGGSSLATGADASLTSGKSVTLTVQILCSIVLNATTMQAQSITCSIIAPGSDAGAGDAGAVGDAAGVNLRGDSGLVNLGGGDSGPVNLGGGDGGNGSDASHSSGSGSGSGSGAGSGPGGGTGTGMGSGAPTGTDSGAPAMTMDAATDTGTPAPTGTLAGQGVDVSDYQTSINWGSAKSAGISFGYAKATEGATWTGTTFPGYYAAMQAAGVKRGAYHFFRPQYSAAVQAAHFISVLQAAGFNAQTDLAPAIDVEEGPGMNASAVPVLQALVQTLQQQLGVTPVIYTDGNTWTNLLHNPDLTQCPLFISNVLDQKGDLKTGHPTIPKPWTNYAVWQNSWVGQISGIKGPPSNNVDTDIANDGASDNTCAVSGTSGYCIDTSQCASKGGKSTAGFCPGAANIECCTM